jgi:hypothetical protein
MEYGAVLIIGHFVISIFQVPLGQPFWQFVPYPNMEICQQQAQYQATPQQGFMMSTEHRFIKTTQCVTREEFEAEMQKQQQQRQPQTQDGWSFD